MIVSYPGQRGQRFQPEGLDHLSSFAVKQTDRVRLWQRERWVPWIEGFSVNLKSLSKRLHVNPDDALRWSRNGSLDARISDYIQGARWQQAMQLQTGANWFVQFFAQVAEFLHNLPQGTRRIRRLNGPLFRTLVQTRSGELGLVFNKSCDGPRKGTFKKVCPFLNLRANIVQARITSNKDPRHGEKFRKSMQREYEILRTLNHPNILTVSKWLGEFVSKKDGSVRNAYLAEWFPDNLHRLLVREVLSYERRLQIAYQIVLGAEYLHSKYILHRDLKPGNILVNGERIVIGDFGQAIGFYDPQTDVYGTKGFRDPVKGAADSSSDVYSLGKIFELMFPNPLVTLKELIERMVNPERRGRPYLDRVKEALEFFAKEAEVTLNVPS
jgi:serine/threonine protein kinase